MELRIYNSNKRLLHIEIALSISILSLVACTQEKSISAAEITHESQAKQIDIFQPVQDKNLSKQGLKAVDLKLVGILITASGDNSALISVGSTNVVTTYRVGDEVSQGLRVISILSDEVIVSESGNNFRIAMTRAVKNEQGTLGKLSQTDVIPNSNTTASGLLPGMVPMTPNGEARPSANSEFREIINQRFQK